MKRILFLGGATHQLCVIEYAKTSGFYTLLCDYYDDNPGIEVADEFFCISTTDKDKVLQIASDNKVDAVIAYATDPAAKTAAYVSEILKLPTNSYYGIETLSRKDLFRNHLKDNGFNYPKHSVFTMNQELNLESVSFEFPMMIKPTDLSGSKGITKITHKTELYKAFSKAMEMSRGKKVILEEYIDMDHLYMVGGDAFVIEGEVAFLGAINSHRSTIINPLVPIGNSYPLVISEKRQLMLKKEIEKVLTSVNFKNGPINIEAMFDKEDKLYIIELGPRNGGNNIPEFIDVISGFDMISSCVDMVVGKKIKIDNKFKMQGYYINYVIHARKSGLLKAIVVNKKFENNLISMRVTKSIGENVECFTGSNNSFGTAFFSFNNETEYYEAMNEFEDLVISIVD